MIYPETRAIDIVKVLDAYGWVEKIEKEMAELYEKSSRMLNLCALQN